VDLLEIAGRSVRVLKCPGASIRAEREIQHGEGAHTGHLLLAWTEGDIDYAVSAHGHTRVNRRMLRAVTASIAFVAPESPHSARPARPGRLQGGEIVMIRH
jgi:hypothetical protein